MVSQSLQQDQLCPVSFIPFLSESGSEACEADLGLLGLRGERPWIPRRVSIPLTSYTTHALTQSYAHPTRPPSSGNRAAFSEADTEDSANLGRGLCPESRGY